MCYAMLSPVQSFDHVLEYSMHVSLYLLLLLIIFILLKLHKKLREGTENKIIWISK